MTLVTYDVRFYGHIVTVNLLYICTKYTHFLFLLLYDNKVNMMRPYFLHLALVNIIQVNIHAFIIAVASRQSVCLACGLKTDLSHYQNNIILKNFLLNKIKTIFNTLQVIFNCKKIFKLNNFTRIFKKDKVLLISTMKYIWEFAQFKTSYIAIISCDGHRNYNVVL